LTYYDCQLTDTILYHYDYSCNIVYQRAYVLYICLLIEMYDVFYFQWEN